MTVERHKYQKVNGPIPAALRVVFLTALIVTLKDEENTTFGNVGNCLSGDAASHTRKEFLTLCSFFCLHWDSYHLPLTITAF
jgi:hypothetical protein